MPIRELDAVFRALADPSRRSLLDRLNDRNGQTLGELCEGLGMTRQAVSKHLAILESAGVVLTTWHGREKRHHLNAAPILAIADRWIRPFDRRRAEALADLTTALESTTMSEAGFVYDTYIRTTPELLWQALTDRAFTDRYWGVELESDWRVGSSVVWTYAGVRMEHPDQVVLVADPPRELSFTWHTITPEFAAAVGATDEEFAAMAAEPRSRVTFTIEPAGSLVRLTVRHSDLLPGGAIEEGVSGGWPMIIASLKSLLETGEPLRFDE